MRSSDLTPLPTIAVPDDRESAAGFLLRAMLSNNMTLAGLWSLLNLGLRGQAAPEHIELLSWYTHAPASWLSWRVPAIRRLDGRVYLEVFGQLWSLENSLRRRRAQHCRICLRAHAPIALEWDLSCYCACPEHGIVLEDHCGHCGRSIEMFRPAWDVCNCGHYLTTNHGAPVVADMWALQWCEWVTRTMRSDQQSPSSLSREVQKILSGMSIDGASRVVIAFGGGKRALASARMSTAQPWLTTSTVYSVVSVGMRRLVQFADSNQLPSEAPRLAIVDLMNLAVTGLTQTDRARAAWLLGHLKGQRIPRRVRQAVSQQRDLFADQEDWP